MQELIVDSLEDLKDNNFNYYDRDHINNIKAVIDFDELRKAVDLQIRNITAQNDRWKGVPNNVREECEKITNLEILKNKIQGINTLIKVRVR